MIHSCLRAVIEIPPISLGRRRTKRISYFPMPITQLVYPPKFANDLLAISPGYYGRPERQRRKQFSCNIYFLGGPGAMRTVANSKLRESQI